MYTYELITRLGSNATIIYSHMRTRDGEHTLQFFVCKYAHNIYNEKLEIYGAMNSHTHSVSQKRLFVYCVRVICSLIRVEIAISFPNVDRTET